MTRWREDEGSGSAADRRFEAVILHCANGAAPAAQPLATAVEAASEHGLAVALVAAGHHDAAHALLDARPAGPGSVFLAAGPEIFRLGAGGPEVAHRAQDAAVLAWLFGELWRRGIAPAVSLVVLDGHGTPALPPQATVAQAPPAAFEAVVADQTRRRRESEPPDPAALLDGWTLEVEGLVPDLERVRQTLLTLSSGCIGTSPAPLGSGSGIEPRVLAGGVYSGEGAESEFLRCPAWTDLPVSAPSEGGLRRRLDLRAGILHQELASPAGTVRAVAFSSLASPGETALWAQAPEPLPAARALSVPSDVAAARGASGAREWVTVRATHGGAAVAARDVLTAGRRRLARLASYVTDPDEPPPAADALARLDAAEARGLEHAFAAHRAAWAARWETADIAIEGDPHLQLALRFALFHLIGSVATEGEAAVGARGMSGSGYRGHVFWDADVFVLPVLAATHPPAARAMIEYRLRRLDAARAAARAAGRRGVRMPWESAHAGNDVTPDSMVDQSGNVIPIRTGELEEHVTADVAWAAVFYAEWSGDERFARGPLVELLVETARYWASRVRMDGDGRAHIDAVIGPDEYHENVDDNAYTNVMARWNLRQAATRAGTAVDERERREWMRIADALVDGFDPATGVYEEFAGFHQLEPLLIADFARRRPIAADMLLGFDRVNRCQIVKQADVLMLHHLVPEAVEPGSLAPNLDFYEPRTAHGSSLSPAIHAALHARAGRLEEAAQNLHIAARIDLEDLTGSAARGLHVATMGGLWQALVFGYAGIRLRDGVLRVAPRLPSEWERLEVRLQVRGTPVAVRIAGGDVTVDAAAPIEWEVDG